MGMSEDLESGYIDTENAVPDELVISRHIVNNDSHSVDEHFLHYTVPENILTTIDTMSLFTSLLIVFGFFTNCIAIGMLSFRTFDRMAYSVLMKILCMYNIVVLFIGALRYQAFYLDYRVHIGAEQRRYFCTYLLWFVHVFRHARTASIMLILYNRIKALAEPDCFVKYMDAIRVPILGNTLVLLVSTVYVSRYIDNLDKRTYRYNRTECTFAYMFPYRRHGALIADDFVSNLPIFEHVCILLMVVVLLIKLFRKSRYRSTPDMDLAEARLKVISQKKLRNASSMAKFSLLSTQGAMEITDILFPVSTFHVNERDDAVTLMTVTIVIINTVTSGLRDAVDSIIVTEIFPIPVQDSMLFRIRAFLDLTFFTFLATMFFFMYATCSYFREAAVNLLYSVSLPEVRSESSVGYPSISHAMPMGYLLHVDSPESRQELKRLQSMPNEEDGDENIFTSGSVWSLDKNYFLNSTRQHALVEKF